MDTTKVLVPVLGLALFVGCPADDADAPLLPGDDDDTTEEEETFPYITDDQGRVLILHGMNTIGSSKHSEGHMPPMDEAVIARMADDWGFNVSRFLIFWDLLEPRPGEINDDYLDAIEPWLDLHHDAGMLVILDMHQDVYSEHFCCDGAPEWAIRDDDIPFDMQSAWFANYLQPAVKRAFDNFWAYDRGEHADLQDHYMSMWAAVAARFKDHPGVMEAHSGTVQGSARSRGRSTDYHQAPLNGSSSVAKW